MTPLALLVLFGLLLGIVVGRVSSKSWFNPASVYSTAWVAVLTAYWVSGNSYYALDSRVIELFGAASLALFIGAIFPYLTPHVPKPQERRYSLYDEDRLNRAHRLAIIGLSLFVVVQLAKVWGVLLSFGGPFAILFGTSGLSFRQAYISDRVASLSQGFSGGQAALGLLSYILFLGFMSLIWGGYYAALGRFKPAILPLVIAAVYSLVLLERAYFLYSLGLTLCSWCYHSRLLGKPAVDPFRLLLETRLRLSILAFSLLAASVVVIPILARRSGGNANQGGVIAYLVSGLAGLNGLGLRDPSLAGAATGQTSPFPVPSVYTGDRLGSGWGSWSLQGLVSILGRLGFPTDPVIPSFSYVQVGPGWDNVSNTYSYLIYLIYDFGFYGAIIACFFIGWIATAAHRRVTYSLDIRFTAIACILMTSLFMSFFGLALIRDFRYWIVGALFVLVSGQFAKTDGLSPEIAIGVKDASVRPAFDDDR